MSYIASGLPAPSFFPPGILKEPRQRWEPRAGCPSWEDAQSGWGWSRRTSLCREISCLPAQPRLEPIYILKPNLENHNPSASNGVNCFAKYISGYMVSKNIMNLISLGIHIFPILIKFLLHIGRAPLVASARLGGEGVSGWLAEPDWIPPHSQECVSFPQQLFMAVWSVSLLTHHVSRVSEKATVLPEPSAGVKI